jgi:hypothetical protein
LARSTAFHSGSGVDSCHIQEKQTCSAEIAERKRNAAARHHTAPPLGPVLLIVCWLG